MGVIGMKSKGDRLDLFEWDVTHQWRAVHFTLRGGWGSTVKAWVMMKHPTLGVLLKPYHRDEPAIVEAPARIQSPAKIDVVTKHEQLDANVNKENLCEDDDDGEDHVVVQKRVAVRLNPY